jgi:signal recognition particle receptor subunit beta
MVSINYAFREISCKIVYYGPGLSGKTTNLQYVHQKVPGKTRGDLISLATDADRTLYFDFLPINLGAIQGFATKFQLYTVPGQVYYNATRKLVLRGVDGLVFVADSQRAKMDENLESLKNLYDNLEEYGYDPADLPIVIQYNKRDLPDVMTVEELQAALNPHHLPHFEAVAVNGTGVFDTLKLIIKLVLDKARSQSDLPKSATTTEAPPAEETPRAATSDFQVSSERAFSPPPREPEEVARVTAGVDARRSAAAEIARPAVLAERLAKPSASAGEMAQPQAQTLPPPVLAPPDRFAPADPGASGHGRAPESTGPTARAFGTPIAPSVIPAAPSLKRTSDGKKKKPKSFWRKLFNWI